MRNTVVQPNASRIPDNVVQAIVRGAIAGRESAPSISITHHDEFSNDLAEVRLGDGRNIIVKRGRHPWAAARFRTSRVAADLLRNRADVTAPAPLELPHEVDDSALDAYWRIDSPTLAEVWPELEGEARREAMTSLGRLIARVHRVRLKGHGPLWGPERPTALSQLLAEDLGGRLMPWVSEHWPVGVPLLELLLGMIPEVSRRGGSDGVLLHGDLHAGNVLCERDGRGARCIGLLDLECAHAGPRESDLARLAVMHTELFNMSVEGPWLEWVMEGYGEALDPLDPLLFHFYAVYHLVHLGYYSALIGHEWHAEQVALAAGRAAEGLRRLERGTPLREAVLVM